MRFLTTVSIMVNVPGSELDSISYEERKGTPLEILQESHQMKKINNDDFMVDHDVAQKEQQHVY